MPKKLFKLNKKLAQGLKTLISGEKRSFSELTTSQITRNFIVLHFGLGKEEDFLTIKKYIREIGELEKEFILDIYPGHPYGFLEFLSLKDSQRMVEDLHSRYREEELKVQESLQNLEKHKIQNPELLQRTVLLDFEGKKRNVFFLQTNLH